MLDPELDLRDPTYIVQGHQLLCSILLRFAQGCKFDILWGSRFVPERRGDSIQIVGSDRNELSSSADILVEFILQVHERRIGSWGELDIAQDCTSEERSDFGSLDKRESGKREEGEGDGLTAGSMVVVINPDSLPLGYTSL